MTLAARIGLAVPDHGVVPLDRIDGLPSDTSRLGADEPHVAYIVRRFDRTADGRVHGEDFNQIADARPRAKYDGHPCEWIARVTAALCSTADVEELVRRLVFGVCVGNGDMHLKNWGVQYPDTRNARLAPMYDFVCTRAYIEDDALALSLGGETRFSRIDRDALERFADGAELSKRRVVTLARETVDRLHDAWAVLKPTIDDTTFTAAIDRNFALTPIARNR
jgi:serine/threonine-protein kinase HipA